MPMIETINLTKKYGELVALNNLNLQIEEGACCGFIGPNGAGKTTTIKILATLLKPTWGEARIDGKTVGYQNPLIRPVIGYVPDFMGAYDDMLVTEYLQFFAACYGIHGEKRERAIRDVLALTDLNYKAESEVNGLSRHRNTAFQRWSWPAQWRYLSIRNSVPISLVVTGSQSG